MATNQAEIVVTGHICLDIIPAMQSSSDVDQRFVSPGCLVNVGPATMALGGAVANTGLALHRLGASIKLVGKIGQDLFGGVVRESLEQHEKGLANHLIVAADKSTSYTIVISPPNIDRGFLHCSGANDFFDAEEIKLDDVAGARILHFGYPPLMQNMHTDGGVSLAAKFDEIQKAGTVVSLDMAMPGPNTIAMATDWHAWLRCVLPHVDFFVPSLDEVLLMLAPDYHKELASRAGDKNLARYLDVSRCSELATELLEMGPKIVLLKLGDQGLFMKTAGDLTILSRRSSWRDTNWSEWENRELLAPCWEVEVIGTTGAGDCTIAGFLMALLQQVGPEAALLHATAVGAYSIQSIDATSGVPPWKDIVSRRNQLSSQNTPAMDLGGWRASNSPRVFLGESDKDFGSSV